MKTYRINEIFYSLQGEGARSGEPSIFVRFSGCNMTCSVQPSEKSPGGFDCDTEFASGRTVSLEELCEWVVDEVGESTCEWIILTGGEPGLQVDEDFVDYFHSRGFKLAIESNGSVELPDNLDWVTVSPKVAEHAIRQLTADEVKYVRCWGQGIPKPKCKATHQFISPAFHARETSKATLDWCVKLCLDNPAWRLSVQNHNLWNVR